MMAEMSGYPREQRIGSLPEPSKLEVAQNREHLSACDPNYHYLLLLPGWLPEMSWKELFYWRKNSSNKGIIAILSAKLQFVRIVSFLLICIH